MSLGIYISVPFCRSKCSFCNFASGVFGREKMIGYVEHVKREIAEAENLAMTLGAALDRAVDSIYLGGGTPTTLAPDQLRGIFRAVHANFAVAPDAEITIECAPGTLNREMIQAILQCGINRVSLGTQSFVDREIRSVGRLHTAEQALADIAVLRGCGIDNLNVDLIAGLPYQTPESWRTSMQQLAGTSAEHASVYMLEVDEDSRLGRELIAGGSRYHAHHVPDSELAADLYLEAIEFLGKAGLIQYEISNFARPGRESRHNLKYWRREPYLGFGLDAHSMLLAETPSGQVNCVRFGRVDDLEMYLAGSPVERFQITEREAAEEYFFLGLRLNCGVELARIPAHFRSSFEPQLDELIGLGLLERVDDRVRLTSRGRLLSNEVFQQFVLTEAVT